MTNELIVYQPPAYPAAPPAEVPPALKRTGEVIGSLAVGALGGYIFYWITRLVAWLGFLGEEGKGYISPLPYILTGVVSAALVETARLVYDAALAVLGDRNIYQNVNPGDKASALDKFRKHSWKVIGRAEGIQRDADVIFSRLFKIRTSEEILNQQIPDRELYFMEISRRAFWTQLGESISTALPQELGIYAVEALGYTVLGGHLFIGLQGVSFMIGLIDKIGAVYRKVDAEIEKEAAAKKKANQAKQPQKEDPAADPAADTDTTVQQPSTVEVQVNEIRLDQQLLNPPLLCPT